ncbi:MAG: ABC transporter substrate-binding protein [Desulfobacterales bacterium]|nr:ABC transporter substrate-binding protein [Desulfobacterales bacterium]
MNAYKKNIFLLILFIFIIVLLLNCGREKTIKIGYVGCLSGRHSDLGISGRNGVILAVEKINNSGGINNCKIELIIRNDRHDEETAVIVDKELIHEKVIAIIGHMTSTMTMKVLPIINKEKIIMISPTTSTDSITGIDDYLIRVMASNASETENSTNYAINSLNLKQITIIYDITNSAYSEGYYKNFKQAFEKKGGAVVSVTTFKSGSVKSYLDLAKQICGQHADSVLIIADALDTAFICQQLQKLKCELPILSSGWAMTDDFIKHAGSSGNGVIFTHRLNTESKNKNYLKFKKNFKHRFGYDHDFAAMFAYEAAYVLFESLKQNSNKEMLKDTILSIKNFKGLQGDIEIDAFGDPKRTNYIVIVENGQFKTLTPK